MLPGNLTALFNGEGRVGIQRVSAHKYRLLIHLGAERYYVHEFARGHTVGDVGLGTQAHILGSSWIGAPMKTIAARDATRPEVGASWGWVPNAPSLNGEYRSGGPIAGHSMGFTTPAGEQVDKIGLYCYRHPTVAGVHRVEIDGRRGVANLLPTAQEYVNLGKLAASVLTTNGGPLLPHDRILDNAPRGALTAKDWVPVAEGLAPGQHTITIVASGVTHPTLTDQRVMIEGYAYGAPAFAWGDAGIDFLPLWGILVTDGSAFEYAHQLKPTAGTAASVFIGCIHGYEQQPTDPTLTLDAAPLSLADGQIAMGTTLAIHRPTELHHPYDAPTLTAAITATDTAVPLTAIPAWVPQSGYVTVEAEVMHYSSRTGSQLNIDVRAAPDTGSGGAAAHASGIAVNFDPGPKIADVDTTYTITRAGIETLHLTSFTEAVQVVRSYPVMFPVDGSQMTHALLGATEYPMTANDGSDLAKAKETQVVFFTDRGPAIPDVELTPYRVAVFGEVLDPADTVENWTYAADSPVLNFFLQDRSPTGAAVAISHMHKGYPTHIAAASPGRTIGVGTVWRSRSRRMAQLVTDHNYDFRAGASVPRGRAHKGLRARAAR